MKSCVVVFFLLVTSVSQLLSSLYGDEFEKKYMQMAQQPGAVIFNPPENWHLADPEALPPSVKIMVVGQGSGDFPPSINLGTERYGGTLKEYLKMIKSINDTQGADWKDLGTIRTQAGTASLSQVDAKTEWGEVRMMHVILLRDGTAYILTAAALKEQFAKYYKDFFKSMRSLRFNKDLYEMVGDPARKSLLESRCASLKGHWSKLCERGRDEESDVAFEQVARDLFSGRDFQVNSWIPFQEWLQEQFRDLGPAWKRELLNRIQSELMSSGESS